MARAIGIRGGCAAGSRFACSASISALLVLGAVLGGCQSKGSLGPEPAATPEAAVRSTGAPTPLSGEGTSAGWQATKPAGGREVEAVSERSALTQPEYYRGSGELISRRGGITEAPVLADGRVSLNFANADIREVIDVVLGKTLNLNYLIDPRVQGTVLARTSAPLKREDVIPALENILALNGAALKYADDLYQVIPLDEASRSLSLPRSTLSPRERGLGFAVTVIPLEFASAQAVQQLAADLVPPDRVFLADPTRNLIVYAGTGAEADVLVDFVRLFDVDWMAGMSFALFPVHAADAGTLASEVEQVFRAGTAGPLPEAVQFLPIERMNAILVMSPQQAYIDSAGRWIERLDRGEGSVTRRVHVYYVQNSRAVDLAAILSQIFEQVRSQTSVSASDLLAPGLTPVELTNVQQEAQAAVAQSGLAPGEVPQAAAPYAPSSRGRDVSTTLGSLVSESGDIRIIPDDLNNALVILATAAEYRVIEAALGQLDIVPLQVLIEATIAEVTLIDTLEYGLQWFFSQGDFAATFSDLDSGLVSSAFPGFSLVFESSDARVILNALTSITDVDVISSPQLMVLDNQSAVLNVGDQVPITIQTAQSVVDPEAPIVSSVEYRDTGVTLEITPRVNASGLVVLDIIQEVSDAVQTESSGIDSPTIQQRRVESVVAVQSGETVALGGLIRDRRTDGVTGIPLLSEIPVLGNLFKTTNEELRRTELLVLITPRVIGNLSEARAVTDELRRRMTGLEVLERRLRPGQGFPASQ